MTLTKEKTTRTNSANYLMMSVQSKDQMGMKGIFDAYQRISKSGIHFYALAYAALVHTNAAWSTHEKRMTFKD